MYRIQDGKLAEHWDVVQHLSEDDAAVNGRGQLLKHLYRQQEAAAQKRQPSQLVKMFTGCWRRKWPCSAEETEEKVRLF